MADGVGYAVVERECEECDGTGSVVCFGVHPRRVLDRATLESPDEWMAPCEWCHGSGVVEVEVERA